MRLLFFFGGFLVGAVAYYFAAQPVDNRSATEVNQSGAFDTHGYLKDCTSRVGNVSYAIAMDKQCLSSAFSLCDAGNGLSQSNSCLKSVAFWMEMQTEHMMAEHPNLEKLRLRVETSSPLGDLQLKDCREVHDPKIKQETICRYQDASLEWYEMRALLRLTDEANEVPELLE